MPFIWVLRHTTGLLIKTGGDAMLTTKELQAKGLSRRSAVFVHQVVAGHRVDEATAIKEALAKQEEEEKKKAVKLQINTMRQLPPWVKGIIEGGESIVEQIVIEIEEKTNRRLVYLKEMRDDGLECVAPDGVLIDVPWEDVVASTGFFKP